MKIELDQTLCTACHACVSVCPKGSITMHADELGFLRPIIDKASCIGCGLCLKACEKTKQIATCSERVIYAAKHKALEVKKKSSSGGVFTALSDCVLQNDGIVVGARYFKDMSVKHDFAKTAQQRDAMRGSKYTYSLCDKRIFTQVQRYLDAGRTVMFTGTPCQVAALKVFLGKEYDNLILVDILCHGIAAPVLYQDFIKGLEKKDLVAFIDFRYTPDGNWHDPKTQVTYQSGIQKKGEFENSYFQMFVRNYCLRESCYNCSYAKFDRVSDITLGDFWGIESCHQDFDSLHGVSVVVVNNEKGTDLFERAKQTLEVLQCGEMDCSHDQLNGLKPGGRNTEFVDDYKKYGYGYVCRKYTTASLSIRIREKLYRVKAIRKLRDAIKGP